MKTIDTIRRAGRSLSQAKTRTLLTSVAIAVGAFTITASLAAGAGGRQYATDLVKANADTEALRVMPKMESERSSKPQEYQEGTSVATGRAGLVYHLLSDNDLATIRTTNGVASVDPVYNLDIKYVTRSDQKKFYASVNTYNPGIAQEYLAGTADTMNNRSILLTDEYRDALGFKDAASAIGQPIQLVIEKSATADMRTVQREILTFTVAGVYKSSGLSFTTGTAMQVNQAAAKEMYDYVNQGTSLDGAYQSAIIHAKPGADVNALKSALENKNFQVMTAQDVMSTLFQFINVLQGILLGFGGLAVLTAIFGIINTQYISVLERTQQIGLMKALGMRRRDVGRLFKFEAAWIGFLGGAIGSILAFVAGLIANPQIDKALGLEQGNDLLIYQPWMFLLVVGGLMFIAVVAGILPSRKAARLDPIEALRTE